VSVKLARLLLYHHCRCSFHSLWLLTLHKPGMMQSPLRYLLSTRQSRFGLTGVQGQYVESGTSQIVLPTWSLHLPVWQVFFFVCLPEIRHCRRMQELTQHCWNSAYCSYVIQSYYKFYRFQMLPFPLSSLEYFNKERGQAAPYLTAVVCQNRSNHKS